MEQKCFSVKSADFEKAIKSLGKVKIDKLLERMRRLEEMENNPSLLPQGMRSAQSVFGKTLSKMNRKEIYVLEMGDDRAMAVVIEKDNKKIYAWFWGGSHEDYNKKLNAKALHESQLNVTASQSIVINEKIGEMKKDESKMPNPVSRAKDIRQKYPHDSKSKNKYNR